METILVVGLLALFGVLETLASLGHLAIILRPAMVGIVAFLLEGLAPELEGAPASTPLWIAVLAVLLAVEFLHYGYHRKDHAWGWLWKIHPTHHTTPSMNVGVIVLSDTHRAHHGFGEWSHEQADCATLVFFFDVLFGTTALPHHPLAATRLRQPVSES